jgi:hypothetical protein
VSSAYILTDWRISQLTPRLAAISHQPPTLLIELTQLNSNLVPLVTHRHGPHRKHLSMLSLIIGVGTCLFAKPLLSNGCCIFSYSAVVAYQRALFIESLRSNGSTCYSMKMDFKAIIFEGVEWINRIYIGTNSRLLWARLWTIVLKKLGISW